MSPGRDDATSKHEESKSGRAPRADFIRAGARCTIARPPVSMQRKSGHFDISNLDDVTAGANFDKFVQIS